MYIMHIHTHERACRLKQFEDCEKILLNVFDVLTAFYIKGSIYINIY